MAVAAVSPKALVILVLALLVAGALVYLAINAYNARAYHYAQIHPGALYRDGMRHPAQFSAACRQGKVKTVVSLVSEEEIGGPRFAPALEQCRKQGIATLHVPVPLGGWPSSEDVQKFLAIAQDPQHQPMLVHCREGIRRTGMMVSAYRLSILGYSKDKAKAEIEAFGHSRRSIGDIERFIDLYDPATRTVTYTSAGKAVSTDE